MAKKILVVDDSALVRKQLSAILMKEGYEVEVAKNGKEACEKALNFNFNAITMDINMPIMDGLSALKEIMTHNPTPVLMVSSLTTEDASITLEALELGAIDYVAKVGTFSICKDESDLINKIRFVARIPKTRLEAKRVVRGKTIRNLKETRIAEKEISKESANSVVLIGSSTGGPGLIEEICTWLPKDFPHAVCVVQHMPEKFTATFAERLNKASKLQVKESEDNEELLRGVVYVAKGGTHLHFRKKVSGKIILKHGNAREKRFFTPSVDEMYFSALENFAPNKMLAVLLTGIGDDGANGMVALKKSGVFTIAESEESATVYGMPKEAYLRGGTCEVLPFAKILRKITSYR